MGSCFVHSGGHLPGMEKIVVGLLVGAGPGGSPLRFTHASRQDADLMRELGQALMNVCNVVPDGVVVFFPSYGYLDHFLASWSGRSAIEGKKAVFVEASGLGESERLLRAYQQAIYAGKGALLLAVMGGRLSEGVNFSDRLARAVLVVGLPFPNVHDAETEARQAFYCQLRGGQAGAASEYLENMCLRSVNQTIGTGSTAAGRAGAMALSSSHTPHANCRSRHPPRQGLCCHHAPG